MLQRTAWRIADQLGWETTYEAEFVALTQLQADVFVTSDTELTRAVSGGVETATIDAVAHSLIALNRDGTAGRLPVTHTRDQHRPRCARTAPLGRFG